MSWRDRLRDRVIGLDDAAALVQSGQRVAVGLPEPAPFLSALAAREQLHDVTILSGVATTGAVAAAAHPGLRVLTGFVSSFARGSVQSGAIEFLPLTFSDAPGFIERFAADVSVVVVAEPLADGTVRPGLAIAFDDTIVRSARVRGATVLALVGEGQPQIPGDEFRVDDFDGFIALPPGADAAPMAERAASEHAGKFAVYLSEFIPDGATIQAGVGGVPDEALGLMADKQDLGVHTEVLGYGLATLIEQGVATGARKRDRPGVAVCTICDPAAAPVADGNPGVQLVAVGDCLNPPLIAQNPLLRCVNSAVEIDLAGQVNAEMISGTQYSGVGGQLDFFRACRLADDALSILLVESTAARGGVSRIVPWIREGNVVTTSRYDVDLVITEHGVAWLRDRTTSERARALIEIAHPNFRASLAESAGELGLLS